VLDLALWTFAAVLAGTTLLPLSGSRAWWVRMWDFPRVHIAAGFLLLLPLALLLSGTGALVLAGVGLAGAGWQIAHIYPYTLLARPEVRLAPEAPDAITCLVANVLMENTDHAAVRGLVERVDPDVLFLMETDARWVEALGPVLARYPQVLVEPRDDCYGLAFATRLPVEAARIVHLTRDGTPTVLAELRDRQGRPFTFVGLHPQPPVPGQDTEVRDAQIVFAARFARKSDRPLVAMGDFNDAAWSDTARTFKRVGGYVDPRVGRGLFASFHAGNPLIRCPIDQIYVTADVAVVSIALGETIGSDHFPLVARLRIDPGLAARLNTPPPPLDPAEVDRLDEITEAYRRGIDETAAEAAKDIDRIA
jgi:endonuclease/exonuclease/phosphatase (EEP) superfamily protein YafD